MLLISLCGLSCACSNKSATEPIVVHVFRDPKAIGIDSALHAVGQMQLKTSRGKPILIATMEPNSYEEGLTLLGHQAHPELVFFSSLDDGAKSKTDIPPQSAVEVSAKPYYLVIPPWASGEQREAAELVLGALRQEVGGR
ncbi:MAG: hypothetical protein P4L51_14155 [Puia sp.]|nr:hypothetical protein [Puia sp.]